MPMIEEGPCWAREYLGVWSDETAEMDRDKLAKIGTMLPSLDENASTKAIARRIRAILRGVL